MITQMSTQEFISRCTDIHHSRYDYSLVDYKKYRLKVIIICPDHGKFKQTPFGHLQGREGCKSCLRIRQVELGLRLPLE